MIKTKNYSKSASVSILLTYFGIIMMYSLISSLANDRLFRQRNIIDTVENKSKIISFKSIHDNYEFIAFSDVLKSMKKPPFIIFYDSSNIEITFNHICNLDYFPGVISRLALVAFDSYSHNILRQNYSHIPNVLIDLEPLKKSLHKNLENQNYILYQLILLTRARVSASLAFRNIDFWAMQQDSIWIDNFASMNLENMHPDKLMLFDTVGNDLIPEYEHMRGWICGSTYFVKGGSTTFKFFRQVDIMMRSRQSPDSAIMTYLCGYRHFKCQRIPRWVISSSNYFRGPRNTVPVMIQVDSDQSKMTKINLFRKANFIFRNDDGTCNKHSVVTLRDSARRAVPDEVIQDINYGESLYSKLKHSFRRIFNIDKYNNKLFLTVHEGLI